MPSSSIRLDEELDRIPRASGHGSALPVTPDMGRSLQTRYSRSSVCGSWALIIEHVTMCGPSLNHGRMRCLADDHGCRRFSGPVILQRGLARQIGDADHQAEPGFGSYCRSHKPVEAVRSLPVMISIRGPPTRRKLRGVKQDAQKKSRSGDGEAGLNARGACAGSPG